MTETILNLAKCDWRIILFAACPINASLETKLRRRADVYAFKGEILPRFHQYFTMNATFIFFLDLSYNSPTERDERLDPSRLSKMIRAENFVDRDMWESIMAENKLACQIGWSLADNNQLSITKIIHILDLKATDLGL